MRSENGLGNGDLTLFLFSSFVASDQEVLVDFYTGLDDQGLLVWNTSVSLCGQTGITCNPVDRVTRLYVWISFGSQAGSHDDSLFLKRIEWLGIEGSTASGVFPVVRSHMDVS